MSQFENQTLLITGANRGIGAALLEVALERGAERVYAASRQPISHADRRVVPVQLDITNPSQVAAAAARVDTLEVLINNAGLALYDDLTDAATVTEQLATNVLGPLAVANALAPALSRSAGRIVNVLSILALAPFPALPGYSISKAAGLSMTQSLRSLMAPRGITVHAALPGPVDTDMARDLPIEKASPRSVAQAIFDGLARNEDEIFPDVMSAQFAEAWRAGASKLLERQGADDFRAMLAAAA